ncbi:MAG: DUF2007 domain-containing protein [Candidatus Omnitrophota bacterium]
MKNKPDYKFVKIYSTPNQGEIAIIKSILDSQGIPYYIKGENFGTLYGPANGLSSMDVMIRDERLEEAGELLKEFIKPS